MDEEAEERATSPAEAASESSEASEEVEVKHIPRVGILDTIQIDDEDILEKNVWAEETSEYEDAAEVQRESPARSPEPVLEVAKSVQVLAVKEVAEPVTSFAPEPSYRLSRRSSSIYGQQHDSPLEFNGDMVLTNVWAGDQVSDTELEENPWAEEVAGRDEDSTEIQSDSRASSKPQLRFSDKKSPEEPVVVPVLAPPPTEFVHEPSKHGEDEEPRLQQPIFDISLLDTKREKNNFLLYKPAEQNEIRALYIPPLPQVLSDDLKIAFAALCILTFKESMYRYARFEYIDLNEPKEKQVQRKKDKKKKKDSRDVIRSGATEDQGLLDSSSGPSDDEALDSREQLQADEHFLKNRRNPSAVVVLDATSKPPSRAPSSSQSLPQLVVKRIPFEDEMINPETIEDVIFFERKIDGNLALCYALKSYQQWSHDVMEELYTDMDMSADDILVIEQSTQWGLKPDAVAQSLLHNPQPAKPFIDIILALNNELPTNPDSVEIRKRIHDCRPFILWHIVMILISKGSKGYTSRSRQFLRRLAVDHLQYGTWVDVVENIEGLAASSLVRSQELSSVDLAGDVDTTDAMIVPKATSQMLLKSEEMEKRTKKNKRKRALLMTAAAIGGGAIIGLSTGLAAPMVGAGLGALLATVKVAGASTFLGGVGGTALITSGGILTGTSLAGLKMAKRTRGVEVFRFIPIHGNKERANVIISISGWVMSKEGRGKNVPVTCRRSSSAGAENQTVESGQQTPERQDTRARSSTSNSVTILRPADSAQKTSTQEEQIPEEIFAVGLQDLIVPFMGVSPVMGSHYALCFDPHVLSTLGDGLKIFTSEVVSFSTQQILQQTILSAVLGPLTWPLWLVKLGYLVDNPWGMGLDRAKKAGELLADALCNNAQSDRPVTLIGFSLGARAIYYCLLELSKRGKYGIIEDVFLFGAPVLMPRVMTSGAADMTRLNVESRKVDDEPVIDPQKLNKESPNAMKSLDEWRQVISMVGGRFVNAFCRTDWVLGFLFRASVAGMWDVAGLRPLILDDVESKEVVVLSEEEAQKEGEPKPHRVPQPETKRLNKFARIIENVDITELVAGHYHYRAAMPQLIRRVCGYATWTDDIDIIEDVVGGEWMEEIDGWWKEETERLKAQRKRQEQQKKKATK